jgi:DNA polymerase III delta prime subunit
MGVAQVSLVEPADALGHAAADALLKTLEEPQPGRYLWLVASEPARFRVLDARQPADAVASAAVAALRAWRNGA